MLVRIRSIFYVFAIIYLRLTLAETESGEVINCDWHEGYNRGYNLQFYCRESINSEENSHRASYFCCENYIYCFGGSWNYKSNFRSIKFMSGCHFSRQELNIFKSYSEIQKITLSNVGLESLRLQDFTYAEHLELLDASQNELTEISAMIFANAPQITDVDFSFNRISRIDPMAFEHSTADHSSKLTTLDLSNNQIVSIDNRTFAALTALNTLYLSSNLIQVIEADVFIQNTELSLLQLTHNKLTSFACQYFENLSSLNLMNNSFKSIDGNCINSGKLLELYIDHNHLTNLILNSNYSSLQAFANELKWITVESVSIDLETFNVSRNRIENIPEILNRFGRTLKFLDLTDNFVGKLNVSTFMKMDNLEELVLRNTSLSNIQHGTFHHQKNLRLLDISFNKLKKINFYIFGRDLRLLETFLLDGNNLTELNGLAKVNFPNVTLIGIAENNFACEYLSECLWQWSGVTLVADVNLLSNQSHVEKIACVESIEDHPVSRSISIDSVTEKLNTQSVSAIIEPTSTVMNEYRDNGSSNRILLILVLVVLCIICITLVTKNVVLLWASRKRFWGRGEMNVTYLNGNHEECDRNSVEINNTNLLHTSD